MESESRVAKTDEAMDTDENDHLQEEGQPNPGLGGDPVNRLACIQCRQRKIKCNRISPCLNCSKSGIECTYGPRQKSTVRRRRIHLSAQHEQKLEDKIENIESQLDQVIHLLDHLKADKSSPNEELSDIIRRSSNKPQPLSCADTLINTPIATTLWVHDGATDLKPHPTFEGESSLSAHTAFASSLLENAATDGPLSDHRLEMGELLSALRSLVDAREGSTKGSDLSQLQGGINTELSVPLNISLMPPMEIVMTTLRQMKERPQFEHVGFFLFLPSGQFTEIVLKVYFPGSFSVADYIIVNGGLVDIFERRTYFEDDPESRKEYLRYAERCENNLQRALSQLPMHLPNTLEYIMAMLFGVYQGIRLSKTSLALSLVTNALRMCITSGFHQAQSMKNDSVMVKSQKTWIFWLLYSTEKGLSLRMGRPSVIQDYDITVAYPEADPTNSGPYSACAIRWFKLSSIQGKVYKRLYSPMALAASQEIRSSWANSLAKEVHALHEDMKREDGTPDNPWRRMLGPMMDQVYCVEEVSFYCVLTLVYRALPAPSESGSIFAPQCIKAAKLALQAHQRYSEIVGADNPQQFDIYINWTILYSPFAPFIIIFCHVIEMRDPSYLAHLLAFVRSMDYTTTNLSEAGVKLRRQFQVLYNVALRYTEMKTTQRPTDPELSEFDSYAQTLGMFPPGVSVGDSGALHNQYGQVQVHAQEDALGEWFSRNQELFTLMEGHQF